MSGDYSRHTFDPVLDFSGVLMQQGRVQLDADWNESVEIRDRRMRAETTDIVGRCVVPKETPDGFKIDLSGETFRIGRGRIYVHGLLAENHGALPLEFDRILAEERGTAPIPYAKQPYLPDPDAVLGMPLAKLGSGPHLVYIDVWQREVSYVENPDLIEKAVGVDTTTRLQTVWQVKVLPNTDGLVITCTMPDSQIPGWAELTRPSAGRLTTAVVEVPTDKDPFCLIPPNGGYRGLENQLYRVEIHTPGPLDTAKFKWSRDNGSIVTPVTAIPTQTTVMVASLGRDSVLRLKEGDWVEITDDWHELAGQPGELRHITHVDEATQTITLHADLPTDQFSVDPHGTRHTRLRRWDQQQNVDVNGGLLDVTAGPISLEFGIQVSFSVDSGGEGFKVGDYWVFAARAADASVEVLDKAPPQGIHHHYGRLAVVTFPSSATDCRTLWPPEVSEEGCDCTVCVTETGTLTIQQAIDQIKDTGGKVCLGPGTYHLGETSIQVDGVRSLQFVGHGWQTKLVYSGSHEAMNITNSMNVSVESLEILAPRGTGIKIDNCLGMTLQRCLISASEAERHFAVHLTGALLETSIHDNIFAASVGIGNISEERLLTAGLVIRDNTFSCVQNGIGLPRTLGEPLAEPLYVHFAKTQFVANTIMLSGDQASSRGIAIDAAALSDSCLEIDSNTIKVSGAAGGLRIAVTEASIRANNIQGSVAITGTGNVQFSDNRCLVTPNGLLQGEHAPPVGVHMNVGEGTLIATGNHLQVPQQAIALYVISQDSEPLPLSIVGNIASGDIIVNNNLLQDPWRPLNVKI